MSFSNIQSPRVIALAAAIAAVSTPAFADSAWTGQLCEFRGSLAVPQVVVGL